MCLHTNPSNATNQSIAAKHRSYRQPPRDGHREQGYVDGIEHRNGPAKKKLVSHRCVVQYVQVVSFTAQPHLHGFVFSPITGFRQDSGVLLVLSP
uniref:Uncharacterized protein n=1 Tax=uncultured marine virus TaxID=186617 RepID=A0A0F7L501_9VIRU|nr:hypothetical protein [uncultured marine virus]